MVWFMCIITTLFKTHYNSLFIRNNELQISVINQLIHDTPHPPQSTSNPEQYFKKLKTIIIRTQIKPVALPVVWNRVLRRHSCQTTDPCSAWGLWVGAVCLSPQLAPGLGIQTGQERGLGGLCGCRTLSCGGDIIMTRLKFMCNDEYVLCTEHHSQHSKQNMMPKIC